MPVRVPVAPGLLEWARQRSGRSEADIEHRYARWHEWVGGHATPTIGQVHDLASYTHVPFGIFFLDEPPQIELPIPDYRLGADGARETPSTELVESIHTSQQRQDWYRDYAIRHDLPPATFVGSARGADPSDAARTATDLLHVDVARRRQLTREEMRTYLRHAFEDVGGLAVFAGIVGNNTYRPLDPHEFRGFTLADDRAPLIFVNANDTLAGQFFTFFHELGHLIRAESGVSAEDVTQPAGSDTERWCNAFAAEVLVPAADLREQYNRDIDIRAELDRLSHRYFASTLVILLRLRDLRLVPREGFSELFEAEQVHIQAIIDNRPPPGGGNFWNNQPFRTGERLARAIIADTYAGGTTFTEALRLLGLKATHQLETYAQHLGRP